MYILYTQGKYRFIICIAANTEMTLRSYTDINTGYSNPNDLEVKVHDSYTLMTLRSSKEKAVVKLLGLIPRPLIAAPIRSKMTS